jgi:histidine ammonia-lyase
MTTTEHIVLDGTHLTIEGVVRAARAGVGVALSAAAEQAIVRGHAALEAHARAGRKIYGLTTGVGPLDAEPLSPDDNAAFQRNLLLSHAAGAGAAMSLERVRAMLVVRANTLAKGQSGVRLETVHAFAALLERGVFPFVPELGSVGASDLAPLAHAALLLIGEGWAFVDGKRVRGAIAMAHAGIALPKLSGRDAFALVNGTSQTLGTGSLAVHDAERLVRVAEIAAAMTMRGVESRTDFLDAQLFGGAHSRSTGVADSASHLRELVSFDAGGQVSEAVREPLSTRCAPQVLGAARTAAAHARLAVEAELNASIDNPSLLADGSLSNNAGTMHAQVVAESLDALVTSAAALASMSERRTARLLDTERNGGLPAFLVHPGARAGLHSGLMIPQYTAAALVGELRAGASPASIQSIPVANGTEDHGSLSAFAARHAAWAIELAEVVVAIELFTAAQAVDLRASAPGSTSALSPRLAAAWQAIREEVPVLVEDRLLADDIETVVAMIRRGRFEPFDQPAG